MTSQREGIIKPRPEVFKHVREKEKMSRRNKCAIGFENFDHIENEDDESEDKSYSSERSLRRSKLGSNSPNGSKNSSETSPHVLECDVRQRYMSPNSKTQEKKWENVINVITNWKCIGTILLLFGVGLSLLLNKSTTGEQVEHENDNEKLLSDNIFHLRKIFPNQNANMWVDFYSGIKTIVTENPTKPSVFLLLHFDGKYTSQCLARKIANEAVKYLNSKLSEPIFVSGEQIKQNTSLIEDYGLFIHSYRNDIEKRHVMVVFDLENIPPVVAQCFHSLCDVDNPTVSKAAYVFTLKVDRHILEEKPIKVAEEVLRSLWIKSLSSSVMDPLITRVANIVHFVYSEPQVPCKFD